MSFIKPDKATAESTISWPSPSCAAPHMHVRSRRRLSIVRSACIALCFGHPITCPSQGNVSSRHRTEVVRKQRRNHLRWLRATRRGLECLLNGQPRSKEGLGGTERKASNRFRFPRKRNRAYPLVACDNTAYCGSLNCSHVFYYVGRTKCLIRQDKMDDCLSIPPSRHSATIHTVTHNTLTGALD
jgi:hypothetical protein